MLVHHVRGCAAQGAGLGGAVNFAVRPICTPTEVTVAAVGGGTVQARRQVGTPGARLLKSAVRTLTMTRATPANNEKATPSSTTDTIPHFQQRPATTFMML